MYSKGYLISGENNFLKRISKEELNEYKIKRSVSLSKASMDIHVGSANGMASKVLLILNDTKIKFDCVKDCIEYCKKEYGFSCRVIKRLLKEQIEYVPKQKRLQKAKGLILRYIDKGVEI